MKLCRRILPLALALALLLSGCGMSADGDVSEPAVSVDTSDVSLEDIYVDQVELEEIEIEDEATALVGAPAALTTLLLPQASGTKTAENSRAVIDYSNIRDGYVMVQFTGTTTRRLKVLVQGPSYSTASKLRYSYDLTPGQWTTFPLSDGNGSYTVTVCENTDGTKYAQVLSQQFQVELKDEFAPFLIPNQYVDYASAPETVAKAAELAGKETDPLKLVEIVYDFVVENFTYDKQLAAAVKSGYLPVLDNVLASRKGICFDYAAMMTGMLRSMGVPCKLVTGYVPTGNGKTGYHAWISVWTEENGWVDGAIYFNGSAWQRMDPTFASSGNQSEKIMKYIGDGSNYTTKYLY